MSFELTDEEAKGEVKNLVSKKLQGIEWTLENVAKIRGEEKLRARIPVLSQLQERLKDKYPDKEE